ncbi:MAG: YdcF family protein [Acidobacteriota bacterium]|nr:YdcF family protein [Acidobacteriota bacterium]
MILRIWEKFKSAAALSVLCGLFLFFSPAVPALAGWLTGDWQEAKGDVLIVLGGNQQHDGTLGIQSYWRCVYALSAFRNGGFRQILISGGPMGDPRGAPVAKAMADFLVALGVPRNCITLENRSRSTRENALLTVPIVRNWGGTKVLLTSEVHMRRAHAAFLRAGLQTVPAPIPDVRKRWNSWADRGGCIADVAEGLAKYAYYAARGWV